MARKQRIGGLWAKTTPQGAELLEGKFSVLEITAALTEVSDGDPHVQLTIWMNKKEDKRTETSPDASLMMNEIWKPATETTPVQPKHDWQKTPSKSDDIPF
jgi:hypothetical protein